jgi:hypothetical protein
VTGWQRYYLFAGSEFFGGEPNLPQYSPLDITNGMEKSRVH